jgi:hypothetical protein
VPLQALWIFLETFGNVHTLKRQFSCKTSVVVTFQNTQDARAVIPFVQQCPFFGSTLTLKHFAGYQDRSSTKTEWNVGPPTDPRTLAYNFTGEHHRNKPTLAFNPAPRTRPDRNLFVANLNETISDDAVKDMFTSRNFTVSEYFRKSAVSAMVQVESVAAGVEALCQIHAIKVNDRFIKVSFSRFAPGPPPERPPAGAAAGGTAEGQQVAVDEQ